MNFDTAVIILSYISYKHQFSLLRVNHVFRKIILANEHIASTVKLFKNMTIEKICSNIGDIFVKAVRKKNIVAAKWLLKLNKKSINIVPAKLIYPAITYACINDDIDMLTFLFDKCADYCEYKIAPSDSYDLNSLLRIACIYNSVNVADWIMHNLGNTIVHIDVMVENISRTGNSKMVEWAIKNGIIMHSGTYPHMLACLYCNSNVAKGICNADNAQSIYDGNMVEYLCENRYSGYLETLEYVLKLGTKRNIRRDITIFTIYAIGSICKFNDIACLVMYYEYIKPVKITAKITWFKIACENNSNDVLNFMCEHFKINDEIKEVVIKYNKKN